ncbi:NAD-specific glutamate dehydrogenase, partial [Thraustotheca clavata]
YIQYSNPRRLANQIALFNRVRGTEGVAVDVEHGWEHKDKENKLAGGQLPQTMLTMACANVLTKHTLQRAATYLALKNLNVRRAHLDVVDDRKSGNGTVSMIRILVSPSEEDHRANVKLDWKEIASDLKYLKWLDDRPLNMALKHKNITISHAEIITTYAHMLHGMLAKVDPYAYSLPRILEVLEQPQHVGLAAKIADLFLERFDPNAPKKMTTEEFNQRREAIKVDIRRNVEAEDTIRLLNTMVDAVGATLRTNRYVKHRYALALRMEPSVLGYGTVGKEAPYGVFFINGRKFKGFHVRFRDIARGGLRVVSPPSADAHALESARQYNEAYNLAFAQQLKNKDIPEGGSKAVVLVEPHVYNDPTTKNFIIRKSVKAFSDALLDLNTTDEAVKSQVVDFYGKDELIYLGPDENIIPADITWMTKRAAYRGYPIPRAFISSKPDVGINHKVYGVTSEGVAVFADVALRSQNIDPKKQPFTVKITGGTDGDVAGNIIKILARDYGSNFRVVGICDGTATIESPEGIDMQELLRLVEESLPLSKFDTTKRGSVILADTPEGIRARNSLHNRVKSDLFIPAGGRPNTINEHNWREYLDPATGKASSPLIVEGANLFTTPEARQLLFDNAGVVIVKDSSANKCGVICSSYEIVSSMLLEPKEFLDIKDELVDDVVKKLRQLALVEAELLFREYKQNPNAALPPSSEKISRCITRLHDAIVANFDNIAEDNKDLLYSLIEEHLPAKLREVALDRVNGQVPLAYIKCIVAASLASKIVYREGLQYVESLPESNLANIAVSYLKQEKKVHALVGELEASNLAHREEIADLLIRGGSKMAWCSRTTRSTGPLGATTTPSVGPGSYNATIGTLSTKPSFAAFGSSEKKKNTTELCMQTPGPGAYESIPTAHALVFTEASSSFFKSTSDRASGKLKSMDTPGPGSYKGAEVSFAKTKKQLSPTRRRRSHSTPDHVTKSGKVKWVRVPTAPSIPNIAQSFGYEEGPKGQMILQQPANNGHTGCGHDISGPGEYDPLESLHNLNKPRGTNFAKSKTTRDNLKPPKKSAAVPGPGSYHTDPIPHSLTKPSAVFKSNLSRDKASNPANAAPIPGPGSYSNPTGIKPARKPEHLQFFGSTSSRFEAEKFISQPSPVPAPESRTVPKCVPRHAAPFASTQQRFDVHVKECTDVGPGTYEASTIVKELQSRVNGRAGVFGSTSKRFEATRSQHPNDALLEKILENTPSMTTTNQENSPESKKMTSSFASGTSRFQSTSTKHPRPSPGDYEISMSWDKPGSKAMFSSHLPREIVQRDKLTIPGPGAYTTSDPTKLKPKYHRHDVFGSTEARFKSSLSPLSKVGPGAYNPDTIENDWNRPTYNITIATEMERRLA